MTEERIPAIPWIEPVVLGVDRTDRGARDWLLRFTRGLAAEPEAFHTSPQQANELLKLAESYADAYNRATSDDTRTPWSVAQKNVTKRVALKMILSHAHFIKAHMHIPAEAKLRLGMLRG